MTKLSTQHWKLLEQFFLQNGFQFVRQEGSHRSYTKEGISRPVVIPTYKEVPVTILLTNLKTAGLSRKDFIEFLGKK